STLSSPSCFFFFFSSRRRHTRFSRDWSSDVCLPIWRRSEVGMGWRCRRSRGLLSRAGAALAGALAAVLVLAGCASGSALDLARSDRPVVLTTFTVLADMARAVAGEHLEVVSLTKEGAEIHGYEPTPGDVAKASQADLVPDNGMGLE